MTRLTIKTGLVVVSLATTLGGWAVLARNDRVVEPTTTALMPEPVVQTLDLPPIPTVARPPLASNPTTLNVQGSTVTDLPPIPMVSAPVRVVRPVARTRSSR